MSKKSAKSVGPITRRQQVAAIQQVKGQEIATAVANNIRDAVKQEVETQLRSIKDTMFALIDRVIVLEALPHDKIVLLEDKWRTDESDSVDRPERAEAIPVQQDDQVVPEKGLDGPNYRGYH